MTRQLPHLSSLAFNVPQYATGAVMASATAALVATMMNTSSATVINHNHVASEAALEVETYEPKQRTKLPVINGLAIIPVHGILVTRAGMVDAAQCVELLSYEKLRQKIQAALDSDDVQHIVLDIDSGGGMAKGCYELAEFIFANRGVKPITAIVNYNTFSAAYFIAAACTSIYVSVTGEVGSIGVRLEHTEFSKWAEAAGITFNTFTRGARKNDLSPHVEMSEETRAVIDSSMDEAYQLFVDSVAKYRNLPVETVINTEAGIYSGQAAIDLGLADHLATPADAINAIAETIPQRHSTSPIALRAQSMQQQIDIQQ